MLTKRKVSRKFYFFLFLFAVLCSLIGCNSPFTTSEGEPNLFCTIADFPKLYSNSSRTIFSDSAAIDSEDYYVFGTNTNGATVSITKIDVNEYGQFSVKFPTGYWEITVFAVPKTNLESSVKRWNMNNIRSNASLIGSAIADLRTSSANVPVKLSTNGLLAGATINAKIVLSDDGGVNKWVIPVGVSATLRIQNIITGEPAYYANGTTVEDELMSFSNSEYAIYSDPIRPGAYTIEVEFCDSDKNTKGLWADIIILQPNRDLTKDIYVTNVIGTIPAAPSNFTATYVDGGQEKEIVDGKLVDHTDRYKVHFDWTDNSNNETSFEIQIADITSRSSDTLSESSWESLPVSQKFLLGKEFKYLPLCADGSLDPNNTQATLWLELGKKYQARIRACNNAGVSAWTYATLPTSVAGISYDGGTLLPFVLQNDPSTSAQSIRLIRAEYFLQGGSYWGDEYAAIFDDRVVYFVKDSSTSTSLWYGEGYDSSDPRANLKKGTKSFIGWALNNPKGLISYPADGSVDYEYVGNIKLYAQYEEVGTLSPLSPTAEYNFLVNWFSYNIGDSGIGTQRLLSPVASNAKLTTLYISRATDIPATGNKNILFSVTIPSDVDNITDGIQRFPSLFDADMDMTVYTSTGETLGPYISSPLRDYELSASFNGISLADLPNGPNTFTFTAYKTIGSKTYSYTVTVVVVLQD